VRSSPSALSPSSYPPLSTHSLQRCAGQPDAYLQQGARFLHLMYPADGLKDHVVPDVQRGDQRGEARSVKVLAEDGQ
jgi:hypothetical protein